jgi:hypothetical protein
MVEAGFGFSLRMHFRGPGGEFGFRFGPDSERPVEPGAFFDELNVPAPGRGTF